MGKTFRRIKACIAGNFGAQGDKIKQWVEANGGSFYKQVGPGITHMIATEAAFRKAVPEVRAAKRIRNIRIVSIEWLEDSLMSKSKRPKREGDYLWASKIKTRKKMELEKREASKSTGSDKKTSEPKDYHLYTDQQGNRYSALLIRPSMLTKFKERHVIKVFESDLTPHTYATSAKYTRVGRNAMDYLALPGSTLDVALRAFGKFFKAKAGIQWDRRGKEVPAKKIVGGFELPPEEGWFEYTPEETSTAPAPPPPPKSVPPPQYDEEAATLATIAMLEEAIVEMESGERPETIIL
ncbi:hypothetical protein LOZ53_001417 [Ophidiomyces ophidiicola]|nr:hypothetical protein LOZ61_001551 [Ophidiomyces ophidiicola]KAI1925449.1 hypothetical protein LOZ60_004178 [Ophidiomyces ophidiicola]KAI1964439.1 hypothetical protein LOZ59_001473 [Ophidiomyces ophidiicola]KAI1979984.1 hypothetical protein LOZ55_001640 [Ophidiomyces ophidiicola]KAI1986575.1 hypothetical protein LOZ54_003849 [Ophidiomyces ophidiicola]